MDSGNHSRLPSVWPGVSLAADEVRGKVWCAELKDGTHTFLVRYDAAHTEDARRIVSCLYRALTHGMADDDVVSVRIADEGDGFDGLVLRDER
jgi:hypothetical protein